MSLSTRLKLRLAQDLESSGTNTDSVLLCVDTEASSRADHGVLASYKHPTTPVVSDGIEAAVRAVLKESGVPPQNVASIMIGSEPQSFTFIRRSQVLTSYSDALHELHELSY